MALAIYTGYVIPRPSMHPWFKWISYINPISYAFENLMSNEFHGRELSCDSAMVPQGPPFDNVSPEYKVCAIAGSLPGQETVLGDNYLYASFQYEFSHLWRNFGILIGFWIFFIVIYAIATEFLRPVAGGGDMLLFSRSGAKAAAKLASNEKVADSSAGTDHTEMDKTVAALDDTIKSSGDIFLAACGLRNSSW